MYSFFKDERVLILNALGVDSPTVNSNEESSQCYLSTNESNDVTEYVFSSETERLLNVLVCNSLRDGATGLYIGVRNDLVKISSIVNNEFLDFKTDDFTSFDLIEVSSYIYKNICKNKRNFNPDMDQKDSCENTFSCGFKSFKLNFDVSSTPALGGFDLILVYKDFKENP